MNLIAPYDEADTSTITVNGEWSLLGRGKMLRK